MKNLRIDQPLVEDIRLLRRVFGDGIREQYGEVVYKPKGLIRRVGINCVIPIALFQLHGPFKPQRHRFGRFPLVAQSTGF